MAGVKHRTAEVYATMDEYERDHMPAMTTQAQNQLYRFTPRRERGRGYDMEL